MAMVLKNDASSGIKQGMDLYRRALHKRDIYIKRERCGHNLAATLSSLHVTEAKFDI